MGIMVSSRSKRGRVVNRVWSGGGGVGNRGRPNEVGDAMEDSDSEEAWSEIEVSKLNKENSGLRLVEDPCTDVYREGNIRDGWIADDEEDDFADGGGEGGFTEAAKKSAVSERGFDCGRGAGGGTGEGGRVENGEAKKALVFETGGGEEDEEADVEEPRSEKVEDMEDALDPDEWDLSEDPPCIGGHSSSCDPGIYDIRESKISVTPSHALESHVSEKSLARFVKSLPLDAIDFLFRHPIMAYDSHFRDFYDSAFTNEPTGLLISQLFRLEASVRKLSADLSAH